MGCFPLHSCIPSASANASSAFAADDIVAPSATILVAYSVALVAIAASFARLANVATTHALCACLRASACLACSCLCAAAFSTPRRRSTSLFALRSSLCWSSSCVDGKILCPARSSVRRCACLPLFGSCLSSIARISGVNEIGSRSMFPLELEASEIEPSLTLSV